MITLIKNRLLDCIRQILQVALLIFIFVFCIWVDVGGIIQGLFVNNELDFENVKYFYLMKMGNISIGIIISGFILFKYIRTSNKEVLINTGNLYHDHFYLWYWFCSKILGYRKCNLVRVPVAMQFKLIIRDTFAQYDWGLDSEYKEIQTETISIYKTVIEQTNNAVNLVLSDTYPLTNKLMPESTKDLPTIFVQRENNKKDVARCYSNEFIETVLNTVRHLPSNIHIVHLYPATNPKHNYYIAQGVFKMAGRSNIIGLLVYPQKGKNGKWDFSEKGIKIY